MSSAAALLLEGALAGRDGSRPGDTQDHEQPRGQGAGSGSVKETAPTQESRPASASVIRDETHRFPKITAVEDDPAILRRASELEPPVDAPKTGSGENPAAEERVAGASTSCPMYVPVGTKCKSCGKVHR